MLRRCVHVATTDRHLVYYESRGQLLRVRTQSVLKIAFIIAQVNLLNLC